jgi:hypothetical protein
MVEMESHRDIRDESGERGEMVKRAERGSKRAEG